jgi:hypothetical protein
VWASMRPRSPHPRPRQPTPTVARGTLGYSLSSGIGRGWGSPPSPAVPNPTLGSPKGLAQQ